MNEETKEAAGKVVGAAKRVDEAIAKLYQTAQDIDRMEPRVMASLRQKYSLPQTMAAVASAYADLMKEMQPLLSSLDRS